jgi:hypothetical protein
MSNVILLLCTRAHLAWALGTARLRSARRDDRGEGVISAAIAVLVMAGIGALMWVGFRTLWQDTEENTRDKVAEIGR